MLSKETVVISGMSGRFPKSQNIAEFRHNLFNKIDMIENCETRFKQLNELIPDRCGQMPNIDKFDSTFFALHTEFANHMDPQGRMLLEHVYEAIIDAGVSPKSLRGSKTGVFLGCCFVDAHESCIREKSGKEVTGSLRTLLANHVSYAMDFKGPSFVIDTACSSSGYAADLALKSIQNGECDAAILAGSNLLLGPGLSMAFFKMGVLSKDGHSRCFDDNANGYCRSDAVVALFLQKSSDAKRIYGKFLHAKKNVDGYKKEGLPFPSKVMQVKLFEDFYDEIGIDPNEVDFIEAHSTGTRVGDLEECPGLASIFCTTRSSPLLIGSLKTNMGHSEAASSASSIVKSLLAFENKKLPPNLHFNKPRSGIEEFENGKLKVVDEVIDFNGSLIGINSFGVGGANVHLLLQSHDKEKINNGAIEDDINRMVCWSGRTEDAINAIFDSIESGPIDAEFIGLLHSSQESTIGLNTYRGFGIFDKNGENGNGKCVKREINNFLDAKRPIVFVYTGMGSQWSQMISDLMKIPIFASSINHCHEILSQKNLNLKAILSSTDESTFDNILHSYVGIASIQIGLTDVLNAIGIKADFIIGHSVGELCCAYADECNSAEEVILAAYSRGMATIETKSIVRGAMAAVGIGYNQLKEMLIDGIEISCHNSSTSCTISGPIERVNEFIAKLKAENHFVKEVNCSNIPFHSSYIKAMGPNLLARLTEVIKNPKERSSKWISTSAVDEAKLSSAEYHTNNLLNPVLFEEAMAKLPENALTIEIAPFGLLQAIIKRGLPNGLHFSLAKKDEVENSKILMESLGRIFINGIDMDISKLYPPVEFPVSRGTAMISPLIKWDHSDTFRTFKVDDIDNNEIKLTIQMRDPNFDFLSGHKIEGKMIFPGTGYIYIACRLAAMHHKRKFEEFDVEFEDIRFLNACFISYEKDNELIAVYHGGDGRFEIREGKTVMCTGYVRPGINARLTNLEVIESADKAEIDSKDFYRELRIRGYHYEKLFQSVVAARLDGSAIRVKWDNNWIAFFDCLAQLMILIKDSRGPFVPIRVRRAILKPSEHLKKFTEMRDEKDVTVTAYYNKELDLIHCPGIEFRGFTFQSIPRRLTNGRLVHENYQFVPHMKCELSKIDAANMCIQLMLENTTLLQIKSVEIDANDERDVFNTFVRQAIENLPIITGELIYLSGRELEDIAGVVIDKIESFESVDCVDLIIKSKCIDEIEKFSTKLNDGGFVISREDVDCKVNDLSENFKIIAKIKVENEQMVIVRYLKNQPEIATKCVRIDDTLDWIEKLKENIKDNQVIIYSQNYSHSGILGLMNCLKREPNGGNIKCVFVDDENAPEFDVSNDFYKKQLEIGLNVNVYRNGSWGSYRHLSLNKLKIPQTNSNEVSAYLDISTRGDFSTIKWFQDSLKTSDGGEIVRIHYAALNFRDIMLASGRIGPEIFGNKRTDQQRILGFEFSGITISGRRVCGFVEYGALTTHIKRENMVLIDCPKNWTLAEAATILGTYGTVCLGLFIKCKLKYGKSILIHAGSGGVGLSALNVAFAMNMEVFTTVSTEEKKNFLLETFPKLKPENVGNSRDTSFEDLIMLRTRGVGVDYVLNSLADEKLLASLRCVSNGGYFVEIGKADIFRDNKINLGCFAKEITFFSLNIDTFANSSAEHRNVFTKFLTEGIEKGFIKPLKTTIFKPNEAEEAFRYLGSGKHVGKVLIQLREGEEQTLETLPMDINPKVYFKKDHSYVICGGLGGFGMELADWMIFRGCKKLVLSSSRGISNSYQTYRLRFWKTYNVEIHISTSDITTSSGCQLLLNEALNLGPISGIFNLAVKLNDGIFENQNESTFTQCMATKSIATKHLDEISRKSCPSLDYFIVFSSVSCGLGNAGQSNYGMTNSIMERIIESRFRDNLPAKAIQWGAIGDVGILADMMDDKTDREISGTLMQRISSCLESLDELISSPDPIVLCMVVAEKGKSSLSSKAALIETVMKILGIKDINAYPAETKVSDFGMDSLLTVEVLQIFEREFSVQLTIDELRNMTLAELKVYSKGDYKKNEEENLEPKSEKL